MFTALEDVKISLNSPVIAQATNGTAYYKVYQGHKFEEQIYYHNHYSKTITSSEEVTENMISGDYHLPAGDKLFVVISAINDTTNVFLLPNYAIDLEGFDSDNAFDFTQAIQLTQYKNQKTNQLTAELEAIDAGDYPEANYNEIVSLYNDALDKIAQANDEEEIDAIIEKLNTDADGVLSLADIEDLKDNFKAQIDAYVEDLNKDDYSEQRWQEILDYVQDFKNELKELETEHAMNIKYNETINNIAQTPRLEKNKKGCGSSNAARYIALALTLAAAAWFTRRVK
ncbi:MAG TPA: hypothetical protein GX745_01255 [Clostridiales bacterium]|nr:hypothetical protein [Clostridiales bacterium]